MHCGLLPQALCGAGWYQPGRLTAHTHGRQRYYLSIFTNGGPSPPGQSGDLAALGANTTLARTSLTRTLRVFEPARGAIRGQLPRQL